MTSGRECNQERTLLNDRTVTSCFPWGPSYTHTVLYEWRGIHCRVALSALASAASQCGDRMASTHSSLSTSSTVLDSTPRHHNCVWGEGGKQRHNDKKCSHPINITRHTAQQQNATFKQNIASATGTCFVAANPAGGRLQTVSNHATAASSAVPEPDGEPTPIATALSPGNNVGSNKTRRAAGRGSWCWAIATGRAG